MSFRDEAGVFRADFTTDPGMETLGTVRAVLDLTLLRRQGEREAGPTDTPQTLPYAWGRLHDEYANRSD